MSICNLTISGPVATRQDLSASLMESVSLLKPEHRKTVRLLSKQYTVVAIEQNAPVCAEGLGSERFVIRAEPWVIKYINPWEPDTEFKWELPHNCFD